MRVLHVPESEHPGFDLLDLGSERGYLAWCWADDPAQPLSIIPARIEGFATSLFIALMGASGRAPVFPAIHDIIQIRWFLDRPSPTLLGPMERQPQPGLLVTDPASASSASSWSACLAWLFAREASLLAAALGIATPDPLSPQPLPRRL